MENGWELIPVDSALNHDCFNLSNAEIRELQSISDAACDMKDDPADRPEAILDLVTGTFESTYEMDFDEIAQDAIDSRYYDPYELWD